MINFDRFPNKARKALTMSYDDGKTYDRRLVEIFNKYKIRGTFHVNGGYLPRPDNSEPDDVKTNDKKRIEPEEISLLYKNHEVSAHGYTHQTLGITPKENIINEIMEDRKILENLTGYPIRGMSYPNGSYNNTVIEILKACGIEYCRVVETHKLFHMPENFLKWQGTCHHNEGLLELGKKFIEIPHKNRPNLMYVWGHSIEFEKDSNWDLIEEFCKMMSERDDIWYATNIEIVDYMNAVKNLKFSADLKMVQNLSSIDVWISIDTEPVFIPSGKITKL